MRSILSFPRFRPSEREEHLQLSSRALIDTEDLLWSKDQQVKRQVWHLWAEVSSQGWHLSDTQRGKISFNVLFSRSWEVPEERWRSLSQCHSLSIESRSFNETFRHRHDSRCSRMLIFFRSRRQLQFPPLFSSVLDLLERDSFQVKSDHTSEILANCSFSSPLGQTRSTQEEDNCSSNEQRRKRRRRRIHLIERDGWSVVLSSRQVAAVSRSLNTIRCDAHVQSVSLVKRRRCSAKMNSFSLSASSSIHCQSNQQLNDLFQNAFNEWNQRLVQSGRNRPSPSLSRLGGKEMFEPCPMPLAKTNPVRPFRCASPR